MRRNGELYIERVCRELFEPLMALNRPDDDGFIVAQGAPDEL
jgi:hypothetical protein